MSEPTITLGVSVLDETLRALLDLPCTFWACKGPDAPFEDMVTCRICAAVQDIRKALTDAQEEAVMPTPETTVVETEFYFVIQRAHIDSFDEFSWVDSSSKCWGTEGDDTAKIAALAERDRLREIFGKDSVHVVRRDVTVSETPVGDPEADRDKELAEALRSCIDALVKIDNANSALTEGRGDLLYDNPDPLAHEMNAATAYGQRTWLEAARVLKSFNRRER